MLSSIKPSAIIFDLDDTLIPSSHCYPLAAAKVIGSDQNWSENFQAARARVKDTLPKGHVSARNRLLYFKAYLEILNDKNRAAYDLYNAYEHELSRLIREWVVKNKRFELLKDLAGKFPLYILTNENSRSQLSKIRSIYPANTPFDLFQGIITSEEIGFEKPHPKIFEALLSRYSLNPDSCLFVGDSQTNDMAPAQALGMATIQTIEFLDERPKEFKQQIISKLDELRGL
jgi:HAD superfamily hydrolase (TIGR01549 family)